jgi:hypothetical protein
MFRRVLPILILAGLASADSAQDARDVVVRLVNALGDRKPADAAALLDPSMRGYAELRGSIEILLHRADAQSTIEVESNTGDDRTRTLKLKWRLDVEEQEGPRGATGRQAEVTCQVGLKDGRWLITAFEPLSLFAPPRGTDAWNLVQAAAGSLSDGNAAGFLSYFESQMPGYQTLRATVSALAENTQVESSVGLVSNQGDDSKRTLETDWTLDLINPDTGIRLTERQQRVKCYVEYRNGRWRIVGIEPLDFFRAPG